MPGFFRLTLKKQKKLQKLLSSVALFSLFLQITSGIFYYQPVIAEEGANQGAEQVQQNNSLPETPIDPNQNPQVDLTPTPTFAVADLITPTPTPTPTPALVIPPILADDVASDSQALDLNKPNEPPVSGQIAPTPTPTPAPICLDEGKEIIDSTNEDWNINLEEDWSQTKEPVKLGVKYVFPQENKVSVTFKCLPEEGTTPLKIEKIKISDLNLPEDINPYGEWAYDITTDMENKTFEYDITLPKPENQIAQVSHMEDVNSEVKTVEEEKISQEGDKVKAEGIDHFTVYFVQSYSDNTYITVKDNYYRGETVYGKATRDTAANMRLRYVRPNGTTAYTCSYSYSTTVYCNYALPSDAPLGQWKVEIGRCDSSCSNINNWWWRFFGEKTFNVLEHKSDLIVNKTNNVGGNATVNQSFNWILTISNNGTVTATFTNNSAVLTDQLPTSGATYGTPSSVNGSGATGTNNCSISSNALTCSSGSDTNRLSIPVGGTVTITIPVTPTSAGTLKNPRDGGTCKVDPTSTNGVVSESNENNNNCPQNVVTVSAVQPAANPPLSQSCGIDVALVLDNSGSVGSDLGTMKNAFKGFVDALSGTPTQFSVTYFNTTAGYTQQVFSGNAANTKTAIDGVPDAGGATNWQDGLLKAKLTFDPRQEVPDLIIFSSDGDPNKYYTDISDENNPTGLTGPGSGFHQTSHDAAVSLANTIKGSGIRIITLGIGGGSDMQSRLVAISSADAYYNASNFDDLATTLNEIVTDLCGGTITINKYIDSVAQGNLATDTWTFTTNIPGYSSVQTTNGQVNIPVPDGSGYSITEQSVLTGYTFDSAVCRNQAGDVGSSISNGVGSITIGNNDIVSCDFVNTTNPTTGTVIVHKDVRGPAGQDITDTTNNFSVDLDGSDTQSITDNGTITYSNIPTGDHVVTESFIPTGYSLYGIGAVAGTVGNDSGLTVNVVSGQTSDVYITNYQQSGNIVVYKDVRNPDGSDVTDNHTFTAQLDGSNNSVFNESSPTNYTVNPGLHTIGEATDSDYTNMGCKLVTGADATNFNVAPGENLSVTCTNKQNAGTISGSKFKDADGNTGTTGDQTGILNWVIELYSCASDFTGCVLGTTTNTAANGSYSFTNLIPGYYQVKEILQSGWTALTSLFHNVTVSPGETEINKNFVNFENVSIKVCKQEDLYGDIVTDNDRSNIQGWSMTLYDDAVQVGSTQLTGADGCYTWTDLGPGNYSVTEESRSGWHNLNSAFHGFGVLLSGSGEHSWTFVNTRLGKVIVKKVMIGGTGTFDFTGDVSGSISTNDGTIELENVVPGVDKTSVETAKSGWDLTDITCDGSDSLVDIPARTVIFRVGSGETVTCTFTNTKLPTLTVNKILNPVGHGAFDLKIDGTTYAYNVGDGGTTGPQTVSIGIHTVSEDRGNASTVMADYSVVYGGDCGETGTIILAAGENKTCTITNTAYGSVLITKDVVPNDSSEWDFTLSGGGKTYNANDLSNDESYLFDDLLPGSYDLTEISNSNYTTNIVCNGVVGYPGSNGYLISLSAGQNTQCVITNTRNPYCGDGIVNGSEACDDGNTNNNDTCNNQCQNNPITIKAYKVVCDEEQYLPDWGDHGSVIGASTAQNFVNDSNGHCQLVDDWKFQYGGIGGFGSFQIETDEKGTPWVTFNVNSDAVITDLTPYGNKVEVREVFPSDEYIGFSNDPGNVSSSVSAEFYCTGDVYNYDNWEWINNPQYGQTYYCVAFNALNYGSVTVHKFEDKNNNALFDEGEPKLDGWDITLGQASKTTANGTVVFDNLTSGDYGLTELIPSSDWRQTNIYCDNQNFAVDSDNQHNVSVAPGEDINCYIGNYQLGYIQGRKYEDLNQDGTRQTGESWLKDWVINLYNSSWEFITSTTTASNTGIYRFENLDIGTYYTCEVLQGDWTQTGPILGGNKVVNQSPNATNEGSICWKSAFSESGQERTGRQFGNIQYGSIDGHKYNDLNGNGNQEWEEPMVTHADIPGGVRIFIDSNNDGIFNNEETNDYTDDNGYYRFEQLLAGTYDICEEIPAGWTITSWSNHPDFPNCQRIFNLAAGENVAHDFGNVQYGSFAGKKYIDYNGDGQYINADGDTLYEGWTIKLYKHDGTNYIYLTEKVTDINGEYLFDNLEAGMYRINEDINSSYVVTDPNEFGHYNAVNLGVGEDLTGFDFGNFELGHAQGCKFDDMNGDGSRQNDIENQIRDWKIRLYDSNWTFEQEKLTGHSDPSDNRYYFDGITYGVHYICEENQAGWTQTSPNAGNGVFNQSGVPGEAPYCRQINVDSSGDYFYGEQFGNVRLGNITVCKYDDYDGDGLQDKDEPGIMGVAMTLKKYICNPQNGLFRAANDSINGICQEEWVEVETQNTQEGGCYTFSGLLLGDYRITEDTASPALAGYEPSDGTETTDDVSLTEGGQTQYVDFFNELQPITLKLAKTHNKVGFTVARGETLTFSLKVKNTAKSTAYGVTVLDVLPDGFSYVPGTGKIDGNSSLPTPNNRQLIWNVGEMAAGKEAVITYEVKVSDSQSRGGHANVAVARGTNRPAGSNDVSTTFSNFAFVHTAVEIGRSFSVSIGGGFVLGAATTLEGQVLGAATGSPTFVLIMAILMILFGLAILLKKGKKLHV